jgi:hypothetical protein
MKKNIFIAKRSLFRAGDAQEENIFVARCLAIYYLLLRKKLSQGMV